MLDIILYALIWKLHGKSSNSAHFHSMYWNRFNELDERRRALIHERDELNATRNRESQGIGTLMKAGKKDEAESRRAAVRNSGTESLRSKQS